MSLGAAIGIDAAVGYGLVVLAVLMLPETRAKDLGEAAAPRTRAPVPAPGRRLGRTNA
jgi:hypothetical protein